MKTRGSVTRAFSKVSSLEGVKPFWIATAANQGPGRSFQPPPVFARGCLEGMIRPSGQAPE